MSAEDPNAKPPTSEEDGKNPAGKPEGKETPPKPEDADKKFTQDDLDRIAAKVRGEEKQKYETAQAVAAQAAEEAEAAKQGEFEKLANDRKVKLDELEPKVAALETERDTLKVTLAEIAEAELKALPKEVSDIAPAQRAEDKSLTNPLDVLAWLPKGKALAEKLNGQSAVKGAKPSPRANGSHGDPSADKQAIAEARRAYRD